MVTTDNMSDKLIERYSSRDEEYEDRLPLFLQALLDRKFSVHKPPPDINWILKKKNPDGRVVGVASRGEIVMVYGPPKSRKSTLLNCITASAFSNELATTLGFDLDLNMDDQIIYLDTEMPQTAFHRRQMKLNKMCGFTGNEDIPNYYAFSLKPFTFKERIAQIDYLVKNASSPIGLMVIDQMADLVGDINDRQHANELIEKLSYWSDISGAIILGALHVSKQSDEMTGVIGSEVAKKMDSGFYLEKMKGSKYTKVIHLLSREEDVENFKFDHNEHGYPILVIDDDHVEF